MASSEGFIVWEWFSDHGRWRPYSPTVSNAIEGKFGEEPVVRLGAVDDDLGAYEINFGLMQQIRVASGKGRTVRRSIVSGESPAAKGIEWQWLDNAGWSEYDLFASQFIEEAFSAHRQSVDLSKTKCHLPYIIDFPSMIQTKHYTGFQRCVRRRLLRESYNRIGGSQRSCAPSTEVDPAKVQDEEDAILSNSTVQAGEASTSTDTTQPSSVPGKLSPKSSPVHPQTAEDSEVPTSKQIRRLSGKRPTSRKAVATKADKKASVAWTSLEEKTKEKKNAYTDSKQKQIVSRAVSVPNELSTSVPPSSSDLVATASTSLTHSATTSEIDSLAQSRKVGTSKMVRSHSTPSQITAKAAYKAGPRLSPVMTAMTSLLISTAIPVTLTPTLFPIHNNPSRIGTRPVKGVPPPAKRRRKMTEVQASPREVIEKYSNVMDSAPEEDCSICFGVLSSPSYYHEAEDETDTGDPVVMLDRCGHCFHKSCLMAMYESGSKDGSIQCPTCKTIYGIKLGNQPPGFMDYHVLQRPLPSFPQHETIRIIYNIPPGIQGPEHPNPGQPYSARRFPRSCYLPDNEIGRRILRLLIVAWERRLIFTVGTSATTGEMNTVVWNEIHHKTEFGSNRSGHGYPDPHYFDNVLAELAAHGVTEESLTPEG